MIYPDHCGLETGHPLGPSARGPVLTEIRAPLAEVRRDPRTLVFLVIVQLCAWPATCHNPVRFAPALVTARKQVATYPQSLASHATGHELRRESDWWREHVREVAIQHDAQGYELRRESDCGGQDDGQVHSE